MHNGFQGKIPSNLSSCSNLLVVDFSSNELTGEIPNEVEMVFNRLLLLDISGNQLTGRIPQWIGNSSLLKVLSLGINYFHGSLPDELGRLAKLLFLQLGENGFSGKFPLSIFNLSPLYYLAVADNQLHGRLPSDIGVTLPNLQYLYIALNFFSGEIPRSLVNATGLKVLDMGGNNFSGFVPSDFGILRNLRILTLEANEMETTEADGLSFITSLTNCSRLQVLQLEANHLKGEIPTSVSNLSTELQVFSIGSTQVSGEIPRYIGNLVGLMELDFSKSVITGEIPSSITKLNSLSNLYLHFNRISGSIPPLGNLTQLQLLNLNENNFSGPVPPSLGNCSLLERLFLGNNYLVGNIPSQVFSLSRILFLHFEGNLLVGQLPIEVGNMTSMMLLSISNNRLSGKIPGTLGNCLMLEELRVGGNLFEGDIPPSFSNLKSLEILDLSGNNLSGQIPKFLQNFTLLQHLNLSFNNFEGEIPTGGVFGNVSAVSISGNKRLCGGIRQVGLPLCEIKRKRRKGKLSYRLKVLISVAVTCLVLSILIAVLVSFLYKKRSQKRRASTDMQFPEGFPKISYAELSTATDGFSTSNLIGEGSFGSVYRVILGGDGRSVAVKVMNLLQKGASKSFIAECEALRHIRHRNLIKIVTVCSSIDFKGIDFKALVYEFMQNGNLDKWLHPNDEEDQASSRGLSFIQRLNIAIDVAGALEYIHDYCQPPIIHGDLKPSNVLLDEDMVAHVGDFGLARFLSSSQNQSSSIGLKGTIGYVPPEYGMSRKVSMAGDVYGFGILLLEMITGKRPTNAVFKDGLTIHHQKKFA